MRAVAECRLTGKSTSRQRCVHSGRSVWRSGRKLWSPYSEEAQYSVWHITQSAGLSAGCGLATERGRKRRTARLKKRHVRERARRGLTC